MHYGIAQTNGMIPEVASDATKKTVELRLKYASLRDYMRYQLSQSVVSNVEPRQCIACRAYFDPRYYRSDRETCSDKCRQRLNWKRRRNAT
jgi:predicted nucleic acid-binding Zn ribbon protein